MKLSHLAVLSATVVSFAAVAQDKPKQEPSAQSGQSQAATQPQEQKQKSGQQMSQSPELIKQAQEKLSAAGHDVGKADGIMGPKTQKGLKEFQQSKGLEASGQLDQKTLAALGVSGEASAAAGASADKPSGASAGTSAERSAEPKASTEKPKE